MVARLAQDQVIAAFGDPRPYVRSDGTVSDEWPQRILGSFPLPSPLAITIAGIARPVHSVTCHRRVMAFMRAALEEIHADAEAWRAWADGGYGGCYCWRANRRNAAELSRHAWGIAIDGDVLDNEQGASAHMHPVVIERFEANGFIWGGRFHGAAVDGMHFEFADAGRLT